MDNVQPTNRLGYTHGAVCLASDSDSDSDHGLGLSPTSPIKRLGPRTESDIRGNICRKSCVQIVCKFVSESKGPDFQQVVSEPRARLEEEAAVLRVEKGVAVLGSRLKMCRLHP
ncbi:hypothetical protein LXL04_001387 [Taraxacum kok-saghyz]